jgi:hypothetical protein
MDGTIGDTNEKILLFFPAENLKRLTLEKRSNGLRDFCKSAIRPRGRAGFIAAELLRRV